METFSAILALWEGKSLVMVYSRHKGQWCGALMCTQASGWANSRYAGDLSCHLAHYDVVVMFCLFWWLPSVVGSIDEIWRCPCIIVSPISVLRWLHYWQRTYDIMITSLLRRNDIATLLLRRVSAGLLLLWVQGPISHTVWKNTLPNIVKIRTVLERLIIIVYVTTAELSWDVKTFVFVVIRET